MSNPKRTCDHCRLHPATRIDYRTFDKMTGRFISCEHCFILSDEGVTRVVDQALDPRTLNPKWVDRKITVTVTKD